MSLHRDLLIDAGVAAGPGAHAPALASYSQFARRATGGSGAKVLHIRVVGPVLPGHWAQQHENAGSWLR